MTSNDRLALVPYAILLGSVGLAATAYLVPVPDWLTGVILLVGVVAGTYSSVFIASPVFFGLRQLFPQKLR